MSEKLVSIIIPVYNAEKYLKKCLDSVISQTYTNIEILLINDGSSDESGYVCEYYEEIDDRVKYFTCLNSGPAFTRNLGLSKATGEYIMFVDSDDYVSHEIVEKLVIAIEKNDGDVAVSYVLQSQEKQYYEKLGDGVVEKQRFMEYLLSDEIKSYLMGKLYRKQLWNNIRFPVGMKVEDLAVLYKVFEHANKIVNVREKLYYYTEDNPNSETRSQFTIDGLYPRFFFNMERFEFALIHYPMVADKVLYQVVSYGNICYFKMMGNSYKMQMEEILRFFKKRAYEISESYTIPLYKKIEASCITHQLKLLCILFSCLHGKFGRK